MTNLAGNQLLGHEMAASPTHEPLEFRRYYKQPPAVVFRIWTDPEAMKVWFRPSQEIQHPFLTVDLRVGGKFRVAFRGPNGVVDVLTGEFLEITAPHRLVYSWEWEPPNEHAGIPSLVTVRFIERDGGTELILTHAISDLDMKQRHSLGWCGALVLLDELVTVDHEVAKPTGDDCEA